MACPLTLPGFDALAAGFDAPMAMLEARHERVRLQREHAELRTPWAAPRGPLQVLAQGGEATAFGAAVQADAARFAALHRRHAGLEEALVFPAAAARLSAAQLQAIGAERATRRGAVVPEAMLR